MKIPNGAKIIISRLSEHGYRGDIVGGCVRDFLLGKEPNDFDITTNALPDEMRTVFSDFRTVDTGIKHGTLTVLVDSVPYEVTTYRIDGEYTDNRHPDNVSFTDKLLDDLSRRDFTVNAMCYNDEDGLTDIFGGKEDLSLGIIRAVGDPVLRFSEDALRILRALRFASTLDFTIEEETAKSIFKTAHLLANVSRERIYVEWKKLIAGSGASRILTEDRSVIQQIIPELSLTWQTLPAEFDAAEAEIRELYLFCTPCGDAPKKFASAMQSLRSDNKRKKFGLSVLENLDSSIQTEADIRVLLVKIGAEALCGVIKLRILLGTATPSKLTLAQQILSLSPCYRISDMNINGNDLFDIGFRGREIGATLEKLLFMIAEGTVKNEKEELSAVAKGLFIS